MLLHQLSSSWPVKGGSHLSKDEGGCQNCKEREGKGSLSAKLFEAAIRWFGLKLKT